VFVQALKHKDNTRVNRAAMGLAALKDPSTIGPLIDALVTTHKFKIVPSNPGAMSLGFGSDGRGNSSGGIGIGGSQTRVVKREIPNEAVLAALVTLTGQNFDFEVKAWKRWYAGQTQQPGEIDFRRG